jgi:hypothetical protein
VDAAELAEGFAQLLREVSPRAVHLMNIPPWGPTLEGVREGLRRSGWAARAFPASPCPVLTVDPGPGAGARLTAEIQRHRRVRSYANRLAREPGFAFEAREDAAELEAWIEQFCDAHEWNWDRTNTPSQYRERPARALLGQVLRAWTVDGVLIRFAVRVDSGPLAFVAAVRARDRLVYHHVATSPAAEELRAGHVMIRLIGLWMAERELATLDFGEGGEGYKYRYATRDETLWRVLAGPRYTSVGYVRGALEHTTRRSPLLHRLWERVGNRWARGALRQALRRARIRARIIRRVVLRSPWRVQLGLACACLGWEREVFYGAPGGGGSEGSVALDPQVVELKTFDVLEMLEEEGGLAEAARADLLEWRRRGATPFGVLENGRVAHVSWLERAKPGWILRARPLPEDPAGDRPPPSGEGPGRDVDAHLESRLPARHREGGVSTLLPAGHAAAGGASLSRAPRAPSRGGVRRARGRRPPLGQAPTMRPTRAPA